MEVVKEKNKRAGLITTIVVHVIMVLLFAFFGLTYLDPPPEEEGITINFGTSAQGMMTEQNQTPSEPEEAVPTPATDESTPTESEDAEEDVITQTTEEAPVVKKEEKKEEVKEPVKKEEPKPDPSLQNALNKWKDNKNTSGGDGETNQPGDQGALDGDKNSNNYTGGGAGNGTSFSLSGRKMVSSPKIQDQSQEEGKVVVDIIVDRKGNVLRATPGARGSTTTSSHLYRKAREAALHTRFNPHPDAAEEQKGQMTFIFLLN